MNKYDKFWQANSESGDVVGVVSSVFGKWGMFHIDAADFTLRIASLESIAPELFAVTWMNESSFKFYPEPNPNKKSNPKDDFDKYDVGPLQTNVGILRKNIENKYLSIKGLDLEKIIGTKSQEFNGDPIENSRLAARLLLRAGRSAIIASSGGNRFELFPALTSQQWAVMPSYQRMERQAVAYTGPEARPYRLKSWKQFSSMFREFFRVYGS